MRPFFCRIGTKKDLIDKIEPLIPPHKTYVEPFVGGGSVFWFVERSSKSVINDLDSELMEGYKILKKGGLQNLYMPPTLEGKQALVNRKAKNNGERLIQLLLMSCNTFRSEFSKKLYKNSNNTKRIKLIPSYSEALKGVTILNTDYKNVIKKYDSPSTFFFLDPPYEESKGLYKDAIINYEEMKELLSSIKGKFMFTINDSPEIRRIFNQFNIKPIIVTAKAKGRKGTISGVDRKELIIMNY
jgi:DNA adenine methylase